MCVSRWRMVMSAFAVALEAGDERRHAIAEPESALLDQHHHARRRRHDLGQRREVEDRVERHRLDRRARARGCRSPSGRATCRRARPGRRRPAASVSAIACVTSGSIASSLSSVEPGRRPGAAPSERVERTAATDGRATCSVRAPGSSPIEFRVQSAFADQRRGSPGSSRVTERSAVVIAAHPSVGGLLEECLPRRDGSDRALRPVPRRRFGRRSTRRRMPAGALSATRRPTGRRGPWIAMTSWMQDVAARAVERDADLRAPIRGVRTADMFAGLST